MPSSRARRYCLYRVDRDISAEEFDTFVRELVPAAITTPFPFVIEGEFEGLKVHVVNGRCQMGAPDPDDSSFRREFPTGSGTLVGFFAERLPGVITHHGSRTHIHVLLDGSEQMMAHVEAVGVRKGALFRFPRVDTQAK